MGAPVGRKRERKLSNSNIKVSKTECCCRRNPCVHKEMPKVIFRINPGYEGRITRSITKVLNKINDFILIEVYRCMPLLGDEENVPNWDVHIVRYAVVFTGK